MGEMAQPTAVDRKETLALAKMVVAAVENDETIAIRELDNATRTFDGARGDFYEADAVDMLLARFAQEIALLRNQLDFISTQAFTAMQSAWDREPDLRLGILNGIHKAARDSEIPDWWESFKREHGIK